MNWKTALLCLVCAVGGLLVGRLPAGRHQPGATGMAGDAADSPRAMQRRVAGGELRETERRSMAMRGSETTAHARLAEISGLPDPGGSGKLLVVPSSLVSGLSRTSGKRSLMQDLFSPGGEEEAWLQIDDREKRSLQDAWNQVRGNLRRAEAGASSAEDLADGSVRIKVPDLTATFASLGKEFRSGVDRTLGENRGEAFMAMKQLDGTFSEQAGERVYTVKVESAGDGTWNYHMRVSGKDGDRVWVADAVPEEIRHLTDAADIHRRINNPVDQEDE